MKITELMSGDWVIRKGIPSEHMQIAGFNEFKNLVYMDFQGRGITENLDGIEPIPLTANILEKNGFVEIDKNKVKETATHIYLYVENGEQEDGFAICGNDANGYYLGTYLNQYPVFVGKYKANKDSNIMSYVYPVYNVKYIHKLQHILKDFEIEKEIIL